MSSEELKPCPFCGSNNLTVLGYGIELDGEHPSERPHAVVCESCGCAGKEVAPMSAAIEAWNTRAQLAAIQGGIGEDVDVVGTLRYFMDYPDSPQNAPGYMVHSFDPASWDHAGKEVGKHQLMTVAQHQRIVAALSAQQSAHVSVPRELLERIQYLLDNYVTHVNSEEDELRALLNGGEA